MKSYYLLLTFLLICSVSKAELPDGVVAPNFTLSDFQTGESFTLQDYVDAGIPVIIDFSATWCPPCWNYHQTHILRDMYDEYGPTGTVNQDAVMVIFIESDYNTNDQCLLGDNAGCNSSTMGDWTDEAPYAMINPLASTGIKDDYDVDSQPILYIVSPTGTIFEEPLSSKSTWESWIFDSFTLSIDNAEVSDAGCDGVSGSIMLDVTGGAGTLSYLWSDGSTDQHLTDVSAGMYTVTITEGRGYEITSETYEIIGAPLLVSAVSGEDVSCFGGTTGSATVMAEGGTGDYTYSWNNGMTTASIENLPAGVYTVEVMDENDCLTMSSVNVSQPLPISEINSVVPSSCGEDNGAISIIASGGTAPFTYTVAGEMNNDGIFEDLLSGTYPTEIVDNVGCVLQVTLVIDEIDEPVAVATANEQPTCANLQVILDGSGSTETGVSYLWSSDNGGVIVAGETTLNPVVEGDGTYNLVVTDSEYGCEAAASVVIMADVVLPLADAGGAQAITCQFVEVQLDGSMSSLGNQYTYNWTTQDGNIISGGNTISPTVNAAGEYQLEVVNNTNGCSSVSLVVVTQDEDLPTASAGMSQSLTCDESTATLDGSGSETGAGINYTWTTDDGSIVSGENTINPVVDAAGVYLLEVYNNANGCSSLASVGVDENTTAPEGSILDAALLTCALDQQALVLVVDGDNISYNWTTADGNIIEGSTSDMPIIDAPGTYDVVYTDLSTGCFSSVSITIEEFIDTPVAQYDFTSDETIFTFMDLSQGEDVTYLWDFGDGNTSQEQNPIHEYVVQGTYQVCLTITNDCGSNTICGPITITIGAALTYTSTLGLPQCNGDCTGTITLTPDANLEEIMTIITGPAGFVAENEYDLNGLCAGVYTIGISNELGESVTESIEVTEPDAILVEESEVVHVDCFGNSNGVISIMVAGGTGNLGITWDNGGEGTTIEGLEGGEYTATIEDEQGCVQSVSFSLEEPTELDVDVESINSIDDANMTGAIDISVEGGIPEYVFLWSNGDETEDVENLDVGEYTVIVTDANGCSETFGSYEIKNLVATSEVEGLRKFEIAPNPANDRFTLVVEFGSITRAEVSLVNSLGQVVLFEEINSTSISKQYAINEIPAGVYMVRVRVGESVSIKKLIKQ